MYQLVDMTQLLDKVTNILNIKLLMVCTALNKLVLLNFCKQRIYLESYIQLKA